MTQEDKYRQQAKVFLRRINEARRFIDNHKPSIGFVGEYLLRKSLHTLMNQPYGICQGFVICNGEISRQCDVIIYTKGKDYKLPECCILNNDNGFVLWFKGSYYGVNEIDPKKTVSFIEVKC